ncbi:phage tail tape measure protein [Terrabacter terrigena]|uniref:Uncharacterized protein n=1 Tax=Terrabacter terrigena TaxID=574718 RepID=A0ABW3MYM7_9MICO
MSEGTNVGTAYLEVIPSAQGFAGRLQSQLGGEMETAGKSSGKIFGNGFGSSLKGAVTGVIATLGIAELAGKAMSFAKDSVAEARESQKVGALTESIIRSTGGAAKITAGQVGDLATAISNKTGVDDEAIQSGANMLLTFKNVKNEVGKGANIFDRATAAAADLSAAGFGDMAGQSKMLGKALNDPIKGISALGRSGVTFSEAQKKQIKTLVEHGKTLDAQRIILKEVESQVGGAAAASATAGEKLSTAWGNFKEGIGTTALPLIDKLATWTQSKVLPALQGVIDILFKGDFTKGFSQAFHIEEDSAVVGFLFGIRDAFTSLVGGVKAFSAAWKANDGDVTSSGFAGFMERAANAGRKVFDYLRDVLPKVGAAASPVLDAFKGALGKVFDAAKSLGPPIGEIATQLYGAYQNIGISTWDLFKAALEALPGIIESLAGALKVAAKWMSEHTTLVGALVTGLGTALAVFKIYKITMTVITGYTKAYAAAQLFLNGVLTANPIGIVVVAIAALAAGLIYAYQNSETFRSYVSTAFSMVKIGALTLAKVAVTAFQFLANVWLTVVGGLLDGAAKAFGWVPGIGPKLQGAADQFNTFKDKANEKLDQIKDDLQVNIDTEQANLAIEALHREFLDKGWTVTAEVNTRMVYGGNGQLVPAPRATGGPVSPSGVYAVGDNPDGSWNRTTELFVPDTAGHIYNQSQLGGALGQVTLSRKSVLDIAEAVSRGPAPRMGIRQLDTALAGSRD